VAPAIVPGSGAFIALIAAMTAMTAMTIDINLPAIPVTAVDLGTSLTMAQLTVTVFFGGFAIGQLLWGSLSDRIGRKPGILVGTVLYEIATVGCALAPDIATLLTLRVIQGIGAGAGAVLGRAIIRDLFRGAQMARILSLVMAAFILAPIVAPSIGALILTLASWRWIFGFLAIYGAVVLLLATVFLDETLQVKDLNALDPSRLLRSFAAVFHDPRSRSWAAVVTLALGPLTVYLANSSAVLMAGYGLSASQFGVAFAVVAVCSSAGSLLNSRLVRRIPLARVIILAQAGSVAMMAAALALAVTGWGGAWPLVGTLALYFVSFGLVVSNATTLALEPHGAAAGSAAAALGFIQTVVPALIASCIAALYDGTAIPMVAAMLVLSALGWLISARHKAVSPASP
jgi:DHA1 family bicyclomycin/chloramphenicol resistance-like MFS transporter